MQTNRRELELKLRRLLFESSLLIFINSFALSSEINAQESQLPSCVLSSVVPRDQCVDTVREGDTIYNGEFSQDKKNGRGTLTYKDGSRYVGEFINDEKEGRGTLISINGDKYIGNWRHNQQNGYGVMNAVDGSVYSGSFVDGIKEGKGSLKYPDGKVLSGIFKNNELVSGFISFPSGETYSGELSNNKKNGYGKSVMPLGETYVGSFENDERTGVGTLIYQTKEKYVGEFKNGRRNGKGALYDASGNVIYSGLWSNDSSMSDLGVRNIIPLTRENQSFSVEIMINQNIKTLAKIELHNKDIFVPAEIVTTMIRMGMLSQNNFIGSEPFTMKDGVVLPSKSFQIQDLRIGGYKVENQVGILDTRGKEVKIGRSVSEAFSAWSIDKDKNILILR